MVSSCFWRRPHLFALSTIFCLLSISPGVSEIAREATKDGKVRATHNTCRASLNDLQGFKDAILRHDQARQGFRTKYMTGSYAKPGLLNSDLIALSPEALVKKTTTGLTRMSDARTALLVYDVGRATKDGKVLCVWLFGPNGLVAADASAALPATPIASLLRQSLHINTRAASRQPVRRSRAKSHPVEIELKNETIPGLAELSTLLIPPGIRRQLLQLDFNRLLILPVADLSTIPWAALPLEDGALIDKTSIVVLADMNWILGDVEHPPHFDPKLNSQIVVGDPDLSGDKDWEFPKLPAARSEAFAVAARYGVGDPLVGGNADRISVSNALKRNGWLGLIYFATHGIADPVNPMDGSFLALKGGNLYGRDIKEIYISSDPLVVMSACQTGIGKVFESGVFGLARAWWYAGAPQIVMSLWNVDDNATHDLMIDFISGLKTPNNISGEERREEALRQAMLKERQREPDPALWAGFALFGLPTQMQSR